MVNKKEVDRGLPKVSVVVPVYNGEDAIQDCIESLLKLDYPKDRLEIIVVDNNSTDSTGEIIKKYPVEYLFEAEKGSYNARNTGIKRARGDLIAFTDSDCIPKEEWITNLVKGFYDEKVGGVGGKIVAYEPKSLLEQYSTKNVLNQEMFANMNPPFLATANAAYRKRILYDVGLFDGSFISGGDVDMGWRVHWAGYAIKFDETAIVFHKHRIKLYDFFKQFFRYGEGNVKLFKKHKKELRKRYRVYMPEYFDIVKDLFLRIPYRIIWVWRVKKGDKSLYLFYPFYHLVQNLSFKLGLISGSLKYREIYL